MEEESMEEEETLPKLYLVILYKNWFIFGGRSSNLCREILFCAITVCLESSHSSFSAYRLKPTSSGHSL
jgi:hypothetical protein